MRQLIESLIVSFFLVAVYIGTIIIGVYAIAYATGVAITIPIRPETFLPLFFFILIFAFVWRLILSLKGAQLGRPAYSIDLFR